MATVTVLGPGGVSRPPYGSFAGKVEFVPGSGPHAAGNITVLGPWGVSRPPYGSFAGKVEAIVVEPEPPVAPPKDFPGGSRGGDITKLIMDKEKLLEDRIHAMDEDIISIIVFAIEEGIIE